MRTHLASHTMPCQPVNPTSRSDSRRKSSGIKKDPRGLSGGEKSFTTVCLLLAMWQAMDSRLRALDEFDVFMDSVNRRIATAMLLEAAEKDPCCQFIMYVRSGVVLHRMVLP